MDNFRKYGNAPFEAALIHGGPGAAGEMAPVAVELCSDLSILEPLQIANTIEGQLDELNNTFKKHTDSPIILIGYSWGAWLSLIFTSEYPELVRKLILISSGPFEYKYAENIMQTRLNRLNIKDRLDLLSLIESLNEQKVRNEDVILARIGELIAIADSYEQIDYIAEEIEIRYDIFQNVWRQASDLRKSGKLLEYANNIKCPVVAIHGNYDPHPALGVQKPLSECIKDFRFIELEKCGHKPWIEKHAKDNFYEILKKEL